MNNSNLSRYLLFKMAHDLQTGRGFRAFSQLELCKKSGMDFVFVPTSSVDPMKFRYILFFFHSPRYPDLELFLNTDLPSVE